MGEPVFRISVIRGRNFFLMAFVRVVQIIPEPNIMVKHVFEIHVLQGKKYKLMALAKIVKITPDLNKMAKSAAPTDAPASKSS